MAVIVAVAVSTDGRREVLGITVMPSEAETFWSDFLRSLTRRGLRGVQMVISDAHEGLKAAAQKVLGAGWQRCRVHFQRNLLARLGKTSKPMVSAVVKTVFAEKDRDQAHARWREVADSLRERFRDVAERMDEAEHDVLAYMAFDESLRAKLHSTNPLERVNKEIKRRTNVVGVRRAILPLAGSLPPPHSPTARPSSDWSALSCSRQTTSGLSAAATCRWKSSAACATNIRRRR